MPATVRLPRTVAARRVLLAGLFLVGFVALGFAFGPGAHAEDRTGAAALTGATSPDTAPAEASTPDRAATRDGAADRLSDSGTEFAQQREEARTEFAEREKAASTAVNDALRPAAQHLQPVTDPLTEPVNGVVQDVRDVAGATLPAILPSGEQAGPGNGAGPGDGDASDAAQQPGSRATAPADCAVASSSALADDLGKPADRQLRPVAHEQRDQGHDGLPGQFPQGPVAPSSHSAGDGHGPRGGDQFAASPADPTRFRLLPGGVRTADGAPTRRRAEEILEFPG
ncbi:hypothetical protein FCH28_17630 [Streptomyces piniterrae]|uniref:Uncharacterized protein n=1 Tax=Streptomyces piniterrae TaxID=2571125 RepID=A0A4U0NFR4_9ACTN|nr:hypothetical protein [Streptomyces piniterrae]TJZ52981.1 hypothetical protein FCH28_17630 [Streptomyces piniterrae]